MSELKRVKQEMTHFEKKINRLNEDLSNSNGMTFHKYKRLLLLKKEAQEEWKLLNDYLRNIADKNNLKPGDRFIDVYNAEVDVVAVNYCEVDETNKYFGKDENGAVDCWAPDEVAQILDRYGLGSEIEEKGV